MLHYSKIRMDCLRTEVFYGYEKILGGEVLLSYTNFSEEFTIHKYASKTKLRGVISQNGNSAAF